MNINNTINITFSFSEVSIYTPTSRSSDEMSAW